MEDIFKKNNDRAYERADSVCYSIKSKGEEEEKKKTRKKSFISRAFAYKMKECVKNDKILSDFEDQINRKIENIERSSHKNYSMNGGSSVNEKNALAWNPTSRYSGPFPQSTKRNTNVVYNLNHL